MTKIKLTPAVDFAASFVICLTNLRSRFEE